MDNRKIFDIVDSSTYAPIDIGSYIATTAVTLAGMITITRCPTNSVPGTISTVGATATNTGNVANNSFVILITAARSDNGAILAQGTLANMDLAIGAISTEFTISYVTPGVNVNVSYELQADPLHNYCIPSWGGGTWGDCQPGNIQYKTETDGCGNSRTVYQYCTYVPPCTDTTWTCHADVGLEYSNCGNTRTTTSCTLATQAMQMVVGAIPEDLRYDVNYNGFVDTGDVTLLMGGTPIRQYAASDGSTPVDTVVCYITQKKTGTIIGWNGVDYRVTIPALNTTTYISPSRLIIGACIIM